MCLDLELTVLSNLFLLSNLIRIFCCILWTTYKLPWGSHSLLNEEIFSSNDPLSDNCKPDSRHTPVLVLGYSLIWVELTAVPHAAPSAVTLPFPSPVPSCLFIPLFSPVPLLPWSSSVTSIMCHLCFLSSLSSLINFISSAGCFWFSSYFFCIFLIISRSINDIATAAPDLTIFFSCTGK